MLTETWLIIVGVLIMTIIVVDGRRKKRRLSGVVPHVVAAKRVDESGGQPLVAPSGSEPAAPSTARAAETLGSYLGAATRIQGVVTARESIAISGDIRGEIHASQRLVLLSLASVQGRVFAGELACEAGAKVNGSVTAGAAAKAATHADTKEPA